MIGEQSKKQDKIVEDISVIKADIAAIKATDSEKEKRCNMHDSKMCTMENRLTIVENKQANQDGAQKTNTDWRATILSIVSMLVAVGAVIYKH